MGYIGMRGPKGYGFSGYLSKGDYHGDLFHFWSKHTNIMTEYVLA